MNRGRHLFWLIAVSCLIAVGCYLYWQRTQPRRIAIQPLYRFAASLSSPDHSKLLDDILLPLAIQNRTPAEQQEFIVKALSDEVSMEGIRALRDHAEFGPLKSIFSNEALAWCSQAGVNMDDCVAFKMERAGIRAEVVMLHEGKTYRIIRCNNVKQMAGI